MVAFHACSTQALADILQSGLHYGMRGDRSKEGPAAQTNAYLDARRPAAVTKRGLSREDCLYMYATLEGKLCDIVSGQLLAPDVWQPEENQCKLAVTLDPEIAYISDLDLYDRALGAITMDTPDKARAAEEYWNSLIPATDFTLRYTIQNGVITKRPSAPSNLPANLGRTELMVTASIPTRHIQLLA